MIRIGHGYDVHAFGESANPESESIVIGGVKIPFAKPLLAHSDGDVLIHALCDALLGAMALGDIGRHFPDTDATYKNIDSRKLLVSVNALLKQQGYCVINADITLIAQAPKMAGYIRQMVANLAEDLDCKLDQVNVKATTTEKLGAIGRGEGVACEVVVLIGRSANASGLFVWRPGQDSNLRPAP